MSEYSLRLFSSLLGDGAFITDLSKTALGWRRSIRLQGGYWQGMFTVLGKIDKLQQFFYEYLGYHVQEKVGGLVTWEGMVYEIDLEVNGVKRRRSLDLTSNHISATYINHLNDAVSTTTTAMDDQSIARYGRKEELLILDGFPLQAIEARRDTALAELAWPWSRAVGIRAPRIPVLNVSVCGYAFTMNWRYTTQDTELDTEQGNLTYGATDFQDDAQDFTDWETAAPGDAEYIIGVVNDDDTYTWAYLGDSHAPGNPDIVDTYTDQGLTVAGWNGAGVGGKTPLTYAVYGKISLWLNDIITNDCEFVTVGRLATHVIPVGNSIYPARTLSMPTRSWDLMLELAEMGNIAGDPWRLYVDTGRIAIYEQTNLTPRYYLRKGALYDTVGDKMAMSPWKIKPAVVRDLRYPVRRSEAGSPLLTDIRDIWIDEVEVSTARGLVLKTGLYSPLEQLIDVQEWQKRSYYAHEATLME